MNLVLLNERLTVAQLPPEALLPAWIPSIGFVSITRTPTELSIVCAAELVPVTVKQEGIWRVFQVEGPLDFALTGILAALATPLAQAGVSIFAISTYDTDYVLVKSDQVESAAQVLTKAGHRVVTN